MGQFFGYVQIAANNTYQIDVGAAGIAGVLIGNESGYTVVVSMVGNNLSKSLYPGTVDFFAVGWGFSGIIQFRTSILLSNSASWPGSYLQIDIVGANEQVSGQYPFSLARIYNVGNAVNTAMANATNIVNDGSVAATQIIEATPGTDLTSAVTLTNSGVLTLGNATHPGSVSFDNAKITSDGSGNFTVQELLAVASGLALSVTGHVSFDGGKITSDGSGNLTINNNTTLAGVVLPVGADPSNRIYQFKMGSLILTFVDSRSTTSLVTLTYTYTKVAAFVAQGGYTIENNGSASGITVDNVTAIGTSSTNTNGVINTATFGGIRSAFNQINTSGNYLVIVGV